MLVGDYSDRREILADNIVEVLRGQAEFQGLTEEQLLVSAHAAIGVLLMFIGEDPCLGIQLKEGEQVGRLDDESPRSGGCPGSEPDRRP